MVVFCLVLQLGRGDNSFHISYVPSVALIDVELSHLTGQDHSGIFGRGAEDCEEGVEDPKDQGQGLQELDAPASPCFNSLSNLFQYENFLVVILVLVLVSDGCE